jgi:hypothetical protein
MGPLVRIWHARGQGSIPSGSTRHNHPTPPLLAPPGVAYNRWITQAAPVEPGKQVLRLRVVRMADGQPSDRET